MLNPPHHLEGYTPTDAPPWQSGPIRPTGGATAADLPASRPSTPPPWGVGKVGLPDQAEVHPPANQHPPPLANTYSDGRSRPTPPMGPSWPSQQLQYLPHHLGFLRSDPVATGSQRPPQTSPPPSKRCRFLWTLLGDVDCALDRLQSIVCPIC